MTSESFILRSGQLAKLFAASNVVSSRGNDGTKTNNTGDYGFRTSLWKLLWSWGWFWGWGWLWSWSLVTDFVDIDVSVVLDSETICTCLSPVDQTVITTSEVLINNLSEEANITVTTDSIVTNVYCICKEAILVTGSTIRDI